MTMDEKWLRMDDVILRKSKDRPWIPVWGYVEDKYNGAGLPRRYDECRIYNSLLVAVKDKKSAMKLSLSEIHPMAARYAVNGSDSYLSTRIERIGFDSVFGSLLVVKQNYVDDGAYNIFIDQDLLIDLRLKQEGDKWVRPCEAYREVIRLSRNQEGQINLVEIKSEYLKDWLCVRNQGLILVSHIERRLLSRDGNEVFTKSEKSRVGGGHWEAWNYGCDDSGNGVLGDWTVMTCGYQSVDNDEDVPVFDHRTNKRSMVSSESIIPAQKISTRMDISQFVRTEWMPPGKTQRRMPFDQAGSLSFICEADGRSKKGKALSFPARYLWFDNAVLKQLLETRGGWIRWCSQETGLIGFTGSSGIHFGINREGLVNVLAKDIAELAWWKQEIWKAHNVCPEGGVCSELTDAQQRCKPAKTFAPESLLQLAFEQIDAAYAGFSAGDPLFIPFDSLNKVGNSIQRFNVQSHDDVLWLAKQINRLVVESLNQDSMRRVAKIDKNEKINSLKLLERVLGLVTDKDRAHSLLSPLHAIYTLRTADSHIPGHEVAVALEKIGIQSTAQLIRQGGRMIFVAAKALHEIAVTFKKEVDSKASSNN